MVSTPDSKLLQGTITLANAAELVSKVVREMAGNDISNSLNGANATSEILYALSLQRIVKNLKSRQKA